MSVRRVAMKRFTVLRRLSDRTFLARKNTIREKRPLRCLKYLGTHATDEAALHASVDHSYILKLYDRLAIGPHQTEVLELEYAGGGSLADNNKPMEERLVSRLVYQLLLAVHHCHMRGVVHRDIRPSNLLLTDRGDLRLSNFGRALTIGSMIQNNGLTKDGNQAYQAPELLLGEDDGCASLDMWSVGCVCFWMLYGHVPFQGATPDEQRHRILSDRVQFPSPPPGQKDVSDAGKDFIQNMLDKYHFTRMSAQLALRHPFVGHGPDRNAFHEVQIHW